LFSFNKSFEKYKKITFLATIFRYKDSDSNELLFCVSVGFVEGDTNPRNRLIQEAIHSLGLNGEGFEYETENGEKPFLKNGAKRIELSVSHTKNVMVVAVSRKLRIGIDVEWAKRNVSPALKKRIVVSEEESKMDMLQLWTMKEAFLKMTGSGLRTAMRSVEISPSDTYHFSAKLIDSKLNAKVISFPWRQFRISVASEVI